MILIAAQTVVFLLVLYCVMVIEAEVKETATKIEAASKLSEMDMISENLMLDCCLIMHRYVRESSEPTSGGVILDATRWEEGVRGHLYHAGFYCTIELGDVVVETLTNQTYDLLQMGFLGEKGDERWYVSAILKVGLVSHSLGTEATYQIGIIA